MQITPVLFTPLFDAREAAAALNVSRQTIARWVLAGHMTPARKAGTAYVFTADEVERVRKAARPRKARQVAA